MLLFSPIPHLLLARTLKFPKKFLSVPKDTLAQPAPGNASAQILGTAHFREGS